MAEVGEEVELKNLGEKDTDQTTDRGTDETTDQGEREPGTDGRDLLGGDDGEGAGGSGDYGSGYTNPADTTPKGRTGKTGKTGKAGRVRDVDKYGYVTMSAEESDVLNDIMNQTDAGREESAKSNEVVHRVLSDLKAKEKILWRVYGARFRGSYGANTRSLMRSLKLSIGTKGGTKGKGAVNGLGYRNDDVVDARSKNTYEPRKVISGYRDGKGIPYEVVNVAKEYTAHLLKVSREYAGTLHREMRWDAGEDADVSKKTGVPKPGVPRSYDDDATRSSLIDEDVYEDALSVITRNVDTKILDGEDSIRPHLDEEPLILKPEDVRELRQVFAFASLRQNPGERVIDGKTPHAIQMESLDRNIKYFGDQAAKAEAGGDIPRKNILTDAVDTSKLLKDYIRVRRGLKPEYDETLGIVREAVTGSDLIWHKRLRRWLKKNFLGVGSAMAGIVGMGFSIGMFLKSSGITLAAAIKKYSVALGVLSALVAGRAFGVGKLVSEVVSQLSYLVGLVSRAVHFATDHIWITIGVALAIVTFAAGYSRALRAIIGV